MAHDLGFNPATVAAEARTAFPDSTGRTPFPGVPAVAAPAAPPQSAKERAKALQSLTQDQQASSFDLLDMGRIQNFNVGIARTLGFPMDIIKTLLSFAGVEADLPGTGERLQALGARVGLTPEVGQERQDFLGRVIQGAGSTALPIAGLAKLGGELGRRGADITRQSLATLTPRGGRAAVAPTALERGATLTVARPGTALSIEAAAVTGAAGLGIIAERTFPNHPIARAYGELIGGFTAGGVAALSPARAILEQGRRTLTGGGAEFRASRAVREAAGTPAAQREAQARLEAGGESTLPPAEIARNRGLVKLQRKAAGRDEALAQRLEAREATAVTEAQKAASFGGVPEEATQFIARLAQETADEAAIAVARLKPGAAIAEVSSTVHAKVSSALDRGSVEETRRWDAVDEADTSRLRETNKAMEEILAGSKAKDDPDNIPSVLRKEIGDFEPGGTPGADDIFVAKASELPVGEASALRSRLNEMIRERRPDKKLKSRAVRNLQIMQEALLKDLESSATGDAYVAATRFSRELNNKFRRGAVGELFNYDPSGGVMALAPEETLQTIIQGSGETPGVRMRQLRQAAPEVYSDIEDYVRNLYAMQATAENGRVIPKSSTKFRAQNQALMREFPELEQQILAAEKSQVATDAFIGGKRLRDISGTQRRESAASLYLDAEPGREFTRVLATHDPAAAGQDLLRLTAQDPTGRATRGLRASWSRFLLQKARSGDAIDSQGNPRTSGRQLRALVEKHPSVRAMHETLLDAEQRARFKRVLTTLEAVEGPAGKEGSLTGPLISDLPGVLLDLPARVVGANVGARAGAGAGAPLVLAGAGSRTLRQQALSFVRDRATDILLEAVESKEVMKVMLTPIADLTPAQIGVLRAALAIPASTGAREDKAQSELSVMERVRRHRAQLSRSRLPLGRIQGSATVPALPPPQPTPPATQP